MLLILMWRIIGVWFRSRFLVKYGDSSYLGFLGLPGGKGLNLRFRVFSSLLIRLSFARGRPVFVFWRICFMSCFWMGFAKTFFQFILAEACFHQLIFRRFEESLEFRWAAALDHG